MKIAVIGLGYVGLPLAIRLSQVGFLVDAIDINSKKIKSLSGGVLPFAQDEPNLEKFFKAESKKRKIVYSDKFDNIKNAEVIIVAVDTPIKYKKPNYSNLLKSISDISKHLRKGQIIIIESTVAPKTCLEIIAPLIKKRSGLELNKDFFLAMVPERIRPNHIFEQLISRPRTVGLSSKKQNKKLGVIYSKITSGDLDFVDLTTAETVKTVENAYRDVNIAFANEVALACEELEVNVWKLIELVNKDPFKSMHKPGAGVGGHCIPKDPWLLASSVKKHRLELIETARKINDNMPNHIYILIKKSLEEKNIKVKNAKLAILGYSYVGNSDDTRNSPTEVLAKILTRNRISYKIYDPYVSNYSLSSVDAIAKNADLLVLMVAHDLFKKIDFWKLSKIMRTKIIIDGRNFFDEQSMKKKGFTYSGIGNITAG